MAEAEAFVGENGEVSMGRAAQYYLGDFGFWIIITGALASMVSAANATVMAGSRVKLAMSRRDHLPPAFEDLHDRFNTPYKSVLLTGGLIALFVVVFSIIFGGVPGQHGEGGLFGLHLGVEALAHFADFMLLVGLIFVNLAIIKSRKKFPDIERAFTVPGVPAVPILAVLANLALLVNVDPKSFALGIIAQLIGIVFWFTWKSKPPSLEEIEERTPTAVADYRAPGHGYQILVPIANPDHVPQLMRTAIALAKDQEDGELLVMSAVELPDQTPLEEGHRYTDAPRSIVEEAIELAEAAGVPASGTVVIGHHAADAIINTAAKHDSDACLMGWGGKTSRRRDVVLGSTVDDVVTKAPCDVYVEKMQSDPDRDFETILLPTAGGPHARLAAVAARSIARSTGATVTAAYVVDPDASAGAKEDARAVLEQKKALLAGAEVETKLIQGDDITQAILAEADQHDLTIIGATREGMLQRLVFGAIPEAVAEETTSEVIMAKRDLGITSRLRRWFKWR